MRLVRHAAFAMVGVAALLTVGACSGTPQRRAAPPERSDAMVAVTTTASSQTMTRTESSCRSDLLELTQYGTTLAHAYKQFAGDLDQGDLLLAQETYNTIGWITGDLESRLDRLRPCRDYFPDAYRKSVVVVADSKDAWSNMRTGCRRELANIGFDC